MDLFTLFGTISIKYADAVDQISRVTGAADEAGKQLDEMGESAEKAQDPIEDTGESAEEADERFSAWSLTLANIAANVITKVAARCADLAKDIVDLGTEFSATMSEVQAISGATDDELAMLEETARRYGATTTFTANDAAQALKYMSLAGWSAEESTSALGGVLDLAAASGMELASASDMVTDYLSAFGMGAADAAYFADLLAFAQANSNTTAAQLGEAYRNCGANLNAAGQDVETVTALLEAMANQGYKGSEAGTALSAAMRDITNAMQDGKIAVGDTSVTVADADGNFRDLTDILTDVAAAVDGLGGAERAAALSTTFTSDSTKALNLILNEGMGNVAAYEDALRGADGAASDMAATMNDNLKGDLASMNSAFDELKLKIFDGAESPLRRVVQFVTDKGIPMLTRLVENFDKVAPAIAGVTAALVTCKAAMTITGVVDALVKSFQAYQLANEGATVAQWLMNGAMLANPAVLIVSLIAGLIAALLVLWNTNDEFREGVLAAWETVKDAVGGAIDAVAGFLSRAWAFLEGYGAYLYDWLDGILSGVRSFFAGIWAFFAGCGASLYDWLTGIISGVQGFFSRILAAFERGRTSLRDWIGGILTGAGQFLSRIGEAVSAFFETVRRVVQTGFLFVAELVEGYVQLVTLPWRFLWENCREVVLAVWDAIRAAVAAAIERVRAVIETVGGTIRDVLTRIWGTYVAIVTRYLNAIRTVWTSVLQFLRDFFTSIWQAIRTVFTTVLTALRDAAAAVFERIRSIITDAIEAVQDVITRILTAVGTFFRTVWETIAEVVLTVLTAIWSTVTSVFDRIRTAITDKLTAAQDIITNILTAIASFFRDIWERICTVVSDQLDAVRTRWETVLRALHDFFVRIWDAIVSFLGGKLGAIRTVVSTAFDAVRTAISDKLEAARRTVTTVLETVRSIFQSKLAAAQSIVTSVFDRIRSGIQSRIERARDTVRDAIERIKGFFRFSWSLPALKLPHFRITGGFSLDPPSVPQFGIDWYAKGGILEQPTVFGISPETGRMQVGGEAGAEAVAPVETLLGFIRTAVREENEALTAQVTRIVLLLDRYLPLLLGAIPREVVLDSGALVGELAPDVNAALGQISEDERRRRG